MDRQPDSIISTIPRSSSDNLLNSWGFDLVREYVEICHKGSFPPTQPVVEMATGTGRMSAVLTRCGYRVITGDLNHVDRPKALDRILPQWLPLVDMVLLDMTVLPIKHGTVQNLVCMNTLHEMDNPSAGIQELLRVIHPAGTLVVGDFNDKGFEVLQELHQQVYGTDHRRGVLPIEEVESVLSGRFQNVRRFETQLNITFIARNAA